MTLTKFLIPTGLLAAGFVSYGISAHAADAPAENDPLMTLAHQAATYVGGARYCNADEELIEEYISKTDAKIKFLAKDEYERVIAQIEFKNILAVASTREPKGGCKAFVPVFEAAVKKAR
ncbi:hypothetical protein [Kordiimonas marina]|uniref:hypothetical protein n=1 Tax=Kordiimonas marina TaxID=2872312 RepID=UPI001FF1CDF9|nr:hypothetical protein [Kordiimonas marina]MCJ9429200.1 hypothetical protein [Kordiimonas marina]